jgi:hypothetical protein
VGNTANIPRGFFVEGLSTAVIALVDAKMDAALLIRLFDPP